MVQTSELEVAGLPPAGSEGVLFLVDISGYVFRAFYAVPPLTNEIIALTKDSSLVYILGLSMAHGLAAQIHGSALLTRTGDGHTSYHTSDCARTATDRYLIRSRAPADRICVG